MIVQVLVPRRQSADPLGQNLEIAVFDPVRISVVVKAGLQVARDPRPLLHLG